MTDKVVIIGGGIIGMMTARMLSDSGAKVILLEKGKLGQEASWAGGGILSPLYPWHYADEISQLFCYGHDHYQAFCQDLYEETGLDPEWINSGILMPSLDELDLAKQWSDKFNTRLEVLQSAAELAEVEPQIHPHFDQALWMPEISQVRNPRILKSLIASLKQRNVEMRENTSALSFKAEQQQLNAVVTDKEIIHCDYAIVATGAWSGQFPAIQAINLNVQPVLGEMILFKAKLDQLKRIILHNGRYLIPRKDGRIVCGSTLAFTEFNKRTTENSRNELENVAKTLAPFLKDYPIEHHWAGLRPGSPNGVPYIGEHPDMANLYINTGHYRYGVTIGLGSVQLLVDHLLQRSSFMDIEEFALDKERKLTDEFREAS